MLPAHLAENIRKQVLFYLQATFTFRDKDVEKAFERFLEDPENGLFKGPWVQLRRPFRPAEAGESVPFDFAIPFHPFKHQNRSWRRLSSRGQKPQPTIVTTGTGSGKTECFLYPILDHCLRARHEGQNGIKAIILYPMNALAADQEKRFARVIWTTPELKNANLRVGNYTGRYDPADPAASAESGTRMMGADHGISHHGSQQENPPDILLTNYKMLDYLLLRPQDQRLWRYNNPGVLRYLVLDELHTYDGAQGADVACLIRRLKERLAIAPGELCVVGTSATLDDRESDRDGAGPGGPADVRETSADRLARFGGTLFEEAVPVDAVIGEDRLTAEEIVGANLEEVTLPSPHACQPLDDEDVLAYAQRQARLWSGPAFAAPQAADEVQADEAVGQWSIELGDWLKRRKLFSYLLDIFQQSETAREGPVTWNSLVERLSREEFGFSDVPQFEDRSLICVSFLALVAQAKEMRSGSPFPLVPTQVQLWIRELRRLGRIVHEKPVFTWLDEPLVDLNSLPAFHCSECGESGWIALVDPAADARIAARGVVGSKLIDDPARIYREWFRSSGHGVNCVVVSPWTEEDSKREQSSGEQADGAIPEYLCTKSLVLRRGDGPCPLTNDPRRLRVKVNRVTRVDNDRGGQVIGDQGCPNCEATEGVFFIGSQGATLSSVAIDELFGSTLNSDPKLLAFTDSVQDASHRAGFFTARTYQFTFRTALQHAIDAELHCSAESRKAEAGGAARRALPLGVGLSLPRAQIGGDPVASASGG